MVRVWAFVFALGLAGCTAGEVELPAWSASGLTLELPAAPKVSAGAPLRLLVVASAPVGTVAALQAKGVPAGATFGDRGDGTAFFFWTPTTLQTGKHEVRITAAAGKQQIEEAWTITVSAGRPGADGTGDPDDPGSPGDTPDDPPPGPVNKAPTLQAAAITSPSFTRAHPLTVVPAGWFDAEGAAPAYITLWFVAGARVTGETDAVLGAAHFARGLTVTAEVYPLDGERIGDPVTAPAVTIGDAPPAITGVELSPGPYLAGKGLAAAATGWSDPDGDAPQLTYRWFIDGTASAVTAATLAGGYARGATVQAEVTPVSGANAGLPLRSMAVTIVNTPPAPPMVRIRAPGVKWNTAALRFDVVTPAADADGDPVDLTYAWYRNGSLFAQGTTQPSVLYALNHGDRWSLRITASDGQAQSAETEAVMTADLRRVKQLALGSNHSCALLNEGFVKCWGANGLGQVGNASATGSFNTAQLVANQSDNVAAIASRYDHTCLVTLEGIVRCWGANAGGQIGTGFRGGSYNAPQDVAGLPVPVRTVATGAAHTCALGVNGRLYCWGDNIAGQLGLQGAADATAPTWVSALAAPVSAVTVGGAHTCALTTDGVVWCWGSNASGQLGAGLGVSQWPIPVSVATGGAMAQVAAGGAHTCARSASGALVCWGNNSHGQLGNGNAAVPSSNVPVGVAGGNAFAYVALGYQHSCGYLFDGKTKCWGASASHQLGTGTAIAGATATPQLLANLIEPSGIEAGNSHSCALMRGGGVKCWGLRTSGQVGDGSSTSTLAEPGGVTGLSEVGVQAVAAGGEHTCALSLTGAVKCWGRGDARQLGNGAMNDSLVPVDVVGLQSGVVQVEAGEEFNCVRLSTGIVKCWGSDEYGQLGNDYAYGGSSQPVPILNSTLLISKKITLGSSHACLVTSSQDDISCWGKSADGAIAHLTYPNSFGGPTYYDVSAGGNHTCVLRRASYGGGIFCAGGNAFGQLGNGTQTNSSTLVAANTSGAWNELALGHEQSCARTGTSVYCWGNGWEGATGEGVFGLRLTPGRIWLDATTPLADATRIVAGVGRTCIISGNILRCFGDAYLGDGTAKVSNRPLLVPISPLQVAISKGGIKGGARGHICAVDKRQALLCWGQNGYGQLGRPEPAASAWPMEALLSSFWW